ncbi:MAG: class I SAM-dependent methyltransferase [Bacteriovoracaceae bacterium]
MNTMQPDFKDLFSTDSQKYLDFRPRYPDQLFSYLASLCKGHQSVWDVGTGNGQAAYELAKTFDQVIGTDPSAKQLQHALTKENIIYKEGTAENPPLEIGQTFDLITVAQAFHWFKHAIFAEVVKKHAKSETHLVVWSYALAFLTPEIDKVVMELYRGVLDTYWDPERQHVENGYQNIFMPFHELTSPAISMSANWSLAHLVGYLMTWSATQKYIKEKGENPVEKFFPELKKAWGDNEFHTITWPLNIRTWKII